MKRPLNAQGKLTSTINMANDEVRARSIALGKKMSELLRQEFASSDIVKNVCESLMDRSERQLALSDVALVADHAALAFSLGLEDHLRAYLEEAQDMVLGTPRHGR